MPRELCHGTDPAADHPHLSPRWRGAGALAHGASQTISLLLKESLDQISFEWKPRHRARRARKQAALQRNSPSRIKGGQVSYSPRRRSPRLRLTHDERRCRELRAYFATHRTASVSRSDSCAMCGQDHSQLAQWLRHNHVRHEEGTLPSTVRKVMEELGCFP